MGFQSVEQATCEVLGIAAPVAEEDPSRFAFGVHYRLDSVCPSM